ncbi:hypothetical protein KIS1582_3071 [Cytobacillus firmus]|uniref:Uncharacterized protein n=1 Tax=Cytobacillus firmus TaxID=1399 RepID=A0A800N9Z7_CYTFI|nr:hypothetical protein KIS1582_3071 [Cytobacillus firmus]
MAAIFLTVVIIEKIELKKKSKIHFFTYLHLLLRKFMKIIHRFFK